MFAKTGSKLDSPRHHAARTAFLAILTAIALFSLTGQANAGTYLKGKTCTLTPSVKSCYMDFLPPVGTPLFQCYSRFSVTSAPPYPSHGTAIHGVYGILWGTYSTSSHAYSAYNQCGNFPGKAEGHHSTSSSRTFTYTLQLYSGGY